MFLNPAMFVLPFYNKRTGTLCSDLWRKSCLMLNCLKFHHIIHDTTASMHQQVLSQKWYPGLTAYCVL